MIAIKNVLVATDFSESSTVALERLTGLVSDEVLTLHCSEHEFIGPDALVAVEKA